MKLLLRRNLLKLAGAFIATPALPGLGRGRRLDLGPALHRDAIV
ncbi:hypothetical protein [Bradyrhizobium sp. 200]|nr:hypothetical protein [Bradyrhizobium sp. 200]